MPEIYKEVSQITTRKVSNEQSKRKLSPKPFIREKCNDFDFAAKIKNSILIHMKSVHTKTGQNVEKQKVGK